VSVLPGESIRNKANILQLRRYCSPDHIPMLRACYIAAKNDGSVFVEPERTRAPASSETTAQDEFFKYITWNPPSIVNEFIAKKNSGASKGDKGLQFFNHVTNYVARNHDHTMELRPSAHLDVAVSK